MDIFRFVYEIVKTQKIYYFLLLNIVNFGVVIMMHYTDDEKTIKILSYIQCTFNLLVNINYLLKSYRRRQHYA